MSIKILPLSLFVFVFGSLPFRASGQAAAEFREHPDIPKEWPREPVRTAHGMVATDEPLASQAGVEILKRGGNAVDATVATPVSNAVVQTAARNIGGRPFVLLPPPGRQTTLLAAPEIA